MKQNSRLRAVMKKLVIAALAASITACGFSMSTAALTADAAAAAASQEATADDYSYISNDDGTVKITGLSGSFGTVAVPSELDGQKVTAIGRRAFEDCTGLSEITLPATVTTIDNYAFFGCDSLKTIKVKTANTVFASYSGVLLNKDKTELICCPKGKTGSYTVPGTVKKILPEAFSSCTKLTGITLSSATESIGSEAFNGCSSLKTITLPDGLKIIDNEVFRDCASLESVNIPSTVTKLGSSAFYCCKKLTSVSIPSSVTELGESAFDGCIGLETVTLSNGLKKIGDCAFSGCRSLLKITLPASLTSLGSDAFFDCRSLESIYVNSSNSTYRSDGGVLYNKSKTKLLTCPEGRTQPCDIPSGVTSIDDYAFRSCRSVKAVFIPDSVTEIADNAFDGSTDVIIYGNIGSTAQSYASQKGMRFVEGDISLTNTSTVSSSAINLGSSVTVNCSCEFSTGTCRYAVYIRPAASSTWKRVQALSTNSKVTIKPESSGKYVIQVQAYDSSDKVSNKDFTISVSQKLTNTSTAPSVINYGRSLTVNCSGSGGIGKYQYEVYYRQKAQTSWTCVQKYNENSTVVIQPKEAVDYVISVKLKDGTGQVVKKMINFTVKPVLGNVSKISSATIAHGSRVKVVCCGKYGSGGYTYAVFYKQALKDSWTCAQNYSTNDVVYITPMDAVRYDVRVKVKDSDGKIANKDFSLNVTPVLTNTSRISAAEIDRGNSVKVFCSGKEGSGELTYAVFYKRGSGSSWTRAQDYSTNSTVTITPKTATNYNIRVRVKDSSGKTAKKDFSLVVKPVLTNTSKISAAKIDHGKAVRVTCSAKEGSGQLSYAVFYKQKTQTSWTCAQNYSTNTTVSIKPMDAVSYDIRVKVKDSSGKIANKDFDLTVVPVLTNTSRISASSIKLGSTVRVICSGKNGTGSLSYAVYYKNSSQSSWTCAQSYGSTTSVTIKPKHTGTYTVRVKIKDENGKIANKDFTLTVK